MKEAITKAAMNALDPRGLPLRLSFLALVVAVILLSAWQFDFSGKLLIFLQWVETNDFWAPFLYILVQTLATVLIVPGPFLTMAGGFLFGLGPGTLYAVLGTTTGALMAFFVGRKILGERLKERMTRNPRMAKIADQLPRHGWKLIAATRVFPFFPFKIGNFFFGVTPVRASHFFWATLVGVIPYTLLAVYLGSFASDLATMGSEAWHQKPGHWTVYIIGFVVALSLAALMSLEAKRRLDKVQTEAGSAPG